ncbi:MAG: hypothetical protein AAGA87_02450 [Pseudomonadota bacterium]
MPHNDKEDQGTTVFDAMLDHMGRHGLGDESGTMDTLPAISKLVSHAATIKSAVLPAERYSEMCQISAAANEESEYAVSLVLPVLDTPLGVLDEGGETPPVDPDTPFLTVAFVDVVPHTAFVLATGLPLSKPSREALEDNGLTLQVLTVREAILTARRASQDLDSDSTDSDDDSLH